MSKKDDIMTGSNDLRQMPFSVPEGYFEGLEDRVRERIASQQAPATVQPARKLSFPMRLIPYLSAAAAIAVVVALSLTLGSKLRKAAVPEDGLADADYVFYYTEIVPVTEPDAIYYSYNYNSDSEALSADDIIEYLVESGVDVETLFNDLN